MNTIFTHTDITDTYRNYDLILNLIEDKINDLYGWEFKSFSVVKVSYSDGTFYVAIIFPNIDELGSTAQEWYAIDQIREMCFANNIIKSL